MLEKVLYVAACVIFPVVWGVIVNWLFNLWQERTADNSTDEPIFPDYQI